MVIWGGGTKWRAQRVGFSSKHITEEPSLPGLGEGGREHNEHEDTKVLGGK
jgi:hypothetical protein